MAPSPREGKPPRAVVWSGPVANSSVGVLLLALSYAIDPHVPLLAQPWISLEHILRSFVWMQFLLTAVNLLPAASLPARRKSAPGDAAATPRQRARPAFHLGTGLAIALILVGLLTMTYWPMNLWPILMGGFLLLGGRMQGAKSLEAGVADTILVREVMLTEYTLLSSSDTLQGALRHTIHSLQDVFPVVRGDRLVGSVSRQTVTAQLQGSGDSYLQGIMTKTLQIASPEEKLVEALRRAGAGGASEFIPVVEDGAMLGILTPQSLSHAVQSVKYTRGQGDAQRQS